MSTLSYPSWFETLYHILMLKEILALFTWLLFRWYNLMKYWFGRMFILRRRWRVWANPGTNFASPVRPAGAVQHRTDHNRTAVHDRTGQHSKVYVYLTEIAAKITTNIINFLKLWFMLLILLNLRILQNNREILWNYLDKNTRHIPRPMFRKM